MTITEFLTARYDEEEAVARAALGSPRRNGKTHARRVLADIAAKRRLVELCATWRADGERHVAGRDAMSIAARTQAITAETVLRALAQPYADHPDFDPAWRVA